MSQLTINELSKLYGLMIKEIDDTLDNVPALKSENEIQVTKTRRVPIITLATTSIQTCRSDVDTVFPSAMQNILDKQIKINDNKKKIAEIQNGRSSDRLKRRKMEEPRSEIAKLESEIEEERARIQYKIYETYSGYHGKLAWIFNKMSHDNYPMWDEKHAAMARAMSYALMGNIEGLNLRQDEFGNKCLYTPISVPVPGTRFPVELHFGGEDNYVTFLNKTDGLLNRYLKDMPEMASRAKLGLRYKNIQSVLGKDVSEIPDEMKQPDIGSNEEKVQLMLVKYLGFKDIYKAYKNLYENSKKRYKKEEYFQLMNKARTKLEMAETELLEESVGDEQFLRFMEDTPILCSDEGNDKRSIIKEVLDLQSIELKKDVIEFLKAYPDKINIIKDLYKDNTDIVGFVGMIKEIKSAEDGERKNEQIERLIYRCVGIGTEGDDCFFPAQENGVSQSEQIMSFISSQGIDVEDLDKKIQEAFEEKQLLKSDGWDLGTVGLSVESFSKVLMNGMMDHNLDFDDIDEIMDYYKKLDMLYGGDENGTIDVIKNKINYALGLERPTDYEEKREQYEQLFEDAVEGRIPEFFEKLPIIITPADAVESYEQINEFSEEWNRHNRAKQNNRDEMDK